MDGLDRYVEISLGGEARIICRFREGFANQPSYAVTLLCQIKGKWCEVVRADDWDGRPHLDRTSPDGTVAKRWSKDTGDNLSNYEVALDWLLENWYKERERYESELN